MASIRMAAASATGRRDENQDAFCVEPDLDLCVVCDGMGGYAGGEVASQTAVEVIRHFFETNQTDGGITWPYPMERTLTLAENMVSVSVRLAHQAICARRHGKLSRMGTTVVIAALCGDEIVLGHVGDSRIYRLRDGKLEQLSRDHSMYNELFDAGSHYLPPPEDFPYKNVVSRALGFSKNGEERPDLRREALQAGDVYLLCTDGLHDVLEKNRIEHVLEKFSAEAACETLVEMAYEAGSTDNITAAVVHVEK